MMREWSGAVLLAVLLVWAGWQAHAAPKEKPRLAVLPLSTAKAIEEAGAIAEELRQVFVNSGRFVVIDRTLTDKILKEWETQQSGMTERDKAVKIGKLFNVQIIVTGKLTQFSSGGWHVSAVILDSQTGVTIKAETVRHRGDFFSLLDEKLPQLAAALVGEAPPQQPPATAKDIRVEQTRPRSTPYSGKRVRIALFPAYIYEQVSLVLGSTNDKLSARIAKLLRTRLKNATFTSSFLDKQYYEQDAIRSRSWKGFLNKEPDAEFVR